MPNAGTPDKSHDWTDTALWKQLSDKESSEADAVRAPLQLCMPKIQTILAKAETAPKAFTLHDADHSFRVAERMVEIIPKNVLPELSIYELALLLLSAYLHDIGMTPEQRKVVLLHQYLLTGEHKKLSKKEVETFQAFLDDDPRDIDIPLSTQKPKPDTLRLANQLIAHYCRDRHNDWSEEWIRKNLDELKLGTYAGCLNDLVALCRSHHEGYEKLRGDRFNPRPVGSSGMHVHLRYLACALRVADILDFDPERTPEVVFRHRDVDESSDIYWYKDHEISSIIQADRRLQVCARPPHAWLQKAIDTTVDEIENELQLVARLDSETHFDRSPTGGHLPHVWDMQPYVARDICPQEGTYDYIDGAFRPNTEKLLELLGGIELYGDHRVAVRELLQNAFDAVRERIAYQRLALQNPGDSSLEDTLGNLNKVDLRLDHDEHGYWLVCTDSGVGMTKEIITNHLLVSGASGRRDIRALERRCQERGFSSERTGQFGIGALSYFMIADRVIVRTRRSQEPNDADPTGWEFTSEGVGAFGELRPVRDLQPGCEIRLHLRDEVCKKDAVKWLNSLRDYLKENLVRIPCKFEFSSATAVPAFKSWNVGPGWVRSNADFVAKLVAELVELRDEKKDAGLLSEGRRSIRETESAHLRDVEEELADRVRWKETEGVFPNGLGRYRIHMPYFKLEGGCCLALLRARNTGGGLTLERLLDGLVFIPHCRTNSSWKGMAVQMSPNSNSSSSKFRDSLRPHVFVECDWVSSGAGKISVTRNALELSEPATEGVISMQHSARSIRGGFARASADSAFNSLHARLLNNADLLTHPINWVHRLGERNEVGYYWRPIRFPATSIYAYSSTSLEGLKWKRKEVHVTESLDAISGSFSDSELKWLPKSIAPDRVVRLRGSSLSGHAAPLWMQRPHGLGRGNKDILSAAFSQKWTSVCGIDIRGMYSNDFLGHVPVWNRGHRLVKHATQEAIERCRVWVEESRDPLAREDELLADKSLAAAWVLACLERGAEDLWTAVHEQDPSFLAELWTRLLQTIGSKTRRRPTPVSFFGRRHFTHNTLVVAMPEKLTVYRTGSDNFRVQFERYLPDPGPDWCLEPVDEDHYGKPTKPRRK